ncbi:hypothetical protein EKO23_03905 [Nocardioides guangzhouensis]|uniref:DUF4232 domain-containing protein n=1 Tax=Nocardioides guangzhouensis TaxID=2497878 RepID=A0A4Q4ZKN8_9ACTN|nr:hypothetical protein [Nocardioides guangzhouensis]RYP88004.1 hypothetical protein EKO23_03905 [Nocardioides guangzhouensis]
MSAVTRPRGPLPARVYWIRRLIVVGVACLLVVGLARLLGGGSDGSSTDAARLSADHGASTPTSRASVPPTATAPVTPRTTKKARPTRPPLAQPSGPCTTEGLTVEPVVDRVTGGSAIRIPFRILTDEAACTFSFSPSTVAVRINSGKDLIWTSQQCRSLPTTDLVVRAAKPAKVSMRWTARRSNEGCKVAEARWAEAGWYHVVAAALGGEPTDQQFRIVNPTSRTITKAPKPDQKDQDGSTPTDEPADGPRSGATEPS